MFEMPKEIKVTTELWKNSEGLHLNLVTDFCGQVSKKVISLQEEATINALVRLGWTPPDPQSKDSFLRDLQRQNTDLQANNTKLVLENRLLRENSESQTQTNEALLKRTEKVKKYIEVLNPHDFEKHMIWLILNGGK